MLSVKKFIFVEYQLEMLLFCPTTNNFQRRKSLKEMQFLCMYEWNESDPMNAL